MLQWSFVHNFPGVRKFHTISQAVSYQKDEILHFTMSLNPLHIFRFILILSNFWNPSFIRIRESMQKIIINLNLTSIFINKNLTIFKPSYIKVMLEKYEVNFPLPRVIFLFMCPYLYVTVKERISLP